MEKMTLQEMEELLQVHEMAEFQLDLDATMATLVDNPVYEFPSIGWHIEGRGAVRETYSRLLFGGDERNIWADKRVHAIDETTLCREAYVYFDTAEGRATGRYMAVIIFENRRILGERMYMDTAFSKAVNEILGPDFGEIPGVSRLEDKSPPPVPRLDRAQQHAADPDH